VTPRVRCCVAVTFGEGIETELNALRRFLGSGALDWIPPHVTLVPPVDCTPAEAWSFVAQVAVLSARAEPVTLELAGFDTFVNRRITGHLPVVSGGGELERWRDQLAPIRDARAYVPHVTVVENIEPEEALMLHKRLSQYRLEAVASEVSLLVAEARGRRRGWRPFARALVGYGGRRMRSHRSVIVMLSRSSPVAHRRGSRSITAWLLDSAGELLGWVEAVAASSGVWVLDDCVMLDSDLVGFGFEELVVEELLVYLQSSTAVVAPEQVTSLDPFGAATLSSEATHLLGLRTFDLSRLGRATDDGQAIRWKFLSFSTR
jgi:2'-5' RNA ligase